MAGYRLMQPPAWAARFVEVPYLEGGSSYDGMDCWGLLERVWADVVGCPLPPYPGPREWRGAGRSVAEAAEAYAARFIEVPEGQEREFDAVLITTGGRPAHVGVVTAPGWMLQMEEGSNVTFERYRPSLIWGTRIAGFYRFEPGGDQWQTEVERSSKAR